MARRIKVLTAHFVANETRPGKYADGGGLFLQITKTGSRSWLYRYVFQGRTRMTGLGSLARLDLVGARKLASEMWNDVQRGVDPYAAKEQAKIEKARAVLFRNAAETYIKAHEPGWKNGGKSADQWRQTLRDHAFPTIGDKTVNQITTSDMVTILTPIWSIKNPTAKKVRNRVELILDAEKAAGNRSGDNPAAWRGNLKALLPSPSKVHKKKSHPALDYEQMPAFMDELRGRPCESARALAFTILTAVRTGDTIGAIWREIDFAIGIWTIPPERHKSERGLRVPLTPPVLAILQAVWTENTKPDDFVFRRYGKRDTGLSNGAMLQLLESMGYRGKGCAATVATTHGFRSSFRDWLGDETDHSRETGEMALGHTLGDQTEEAYRRRDALRKRQVAMSAWSIYCCGTTAEDGNLGPLLEVGKASAAPPRQKRRRQPASAPPRGGAIPEPRTESIGGRSRMNDAIERAARMNCEPKRKLPQGHIGRGLAHVLGMSDAEFAQHKERLVARAKAAEAREDGV